MSEYGQMTTQITYNPLTTIIGVIGIICLWKILEDRGEKGWKSLIPFYSTYVFGRTFNEEKLAMKVIYSCIALIFSMIGLVTSLVAQNSILLFILFILFIVALVVTLVLEIKFFKAFDIANGGPSWMIILWILLTPVAYIYYAFIHKNYDIPGVTDKE